jgi:undecaprenyl-diphosphatase
VVLSAATQPSRRLLLTTTGLVLASLAVFMLIAEDVLNGGGLISHDEAILTWFVDHRTNWMITVARVVSAVGGFASLLCVGVALGLWLWRRGWHFVIAIAPAVSLLLAGLSAAVAKAVFGRARPPISLHETHVASPAFPSGHATDAAGFFLAAAFVLAITVAHHRRTQLAFTGIGILFAALVGLSRLVLAVHWLSDVVAGWALGTAIAITVVVVLWYDATRRRRESQMDRDSPTETGSAVA